MRTCLGAFENEKVIDLNAAYQKLLVEKGTPHPEAGAGSELPIDLLSFIEKNEIALSAAKKNLDYVMKKDYQVVGCVHPPSQIIFGYTIFNDITARSLEATNREFQPWGKNIVTFAPMGPWILPI